MFVKHIILITEYILSSLTHDTLSDNTLAVTAVSTLRKRSLWEPLRYAVWRKYGVLKDLSHTEQPGLLPMDTNVSLLLILGCNIGQPLECNRSNFKKYPNSATTNRITHMCCPDFQPPRRYRNTNCSSSDTIQTFLVWAKVKRIAGELISVLKIKTKNVRILLDVV
jgi:hypothetical protein